MKYSKSYDSPFGKMWMSSDGEYLTGLWFADSKDADKHGEFGNTCELPVFDETSKWLDMYFRGDKPDFIPKYKVEGLTQFRKEVTEIMEKIPYGEVVTYKDIALEIARRRGISNMSSQAVGGAVGWNPICIIIPCHRVVGVNGNLTGYGGGMKNKVALLELEGHNMENFWVPYGRNEQER